MRYRDRAINLGGGGAAPAGMFERLDGVVECGMTRGATETTEKMKAGPAEKVRRPHPLGRFSLRMARGTAAGVRQRTR